MGCWLLRELLRRSYTFAIYAPLGRHSISSHYGSLAEGKLFLGQVDIENWIN